MGKRFRIFFASDLHGSERAFRKFLKAGTFYGVDAVMFGGDLTGKALVPIVETRPGRFEADHFGHRYEVEGESALADLEDAIRMGGLYPLRTTPDEVAALNADAELLHRTFTRVMIEAATRWMAMADEKFRAAKLPVLLMLGNDDEPEVRPVLAQGSWVTDAEERVVSLGDYQVLSLGYATTTPWHSPREVTEAEMADRLQRLTTLVDPSQPLILNFHNPPFGTGIDLAPKMTEDLRAVMTGGQPEMVPVGSHAVADAIAVMRPVVSLHGHIHESRGAGRVGATPVLNPGSAYNEGVLQGVIVTLEGRRFVGHQFVTG